MQLSDRIFIQVSIVVGIAALLLSASHSLVAWDLFPQMLLFVSLIVVASFLIIQDPSGGVISSTGTLFYVVLYVFNPVTAFLIVSLGYAIGNTLPRNWVTWRTCFNGAQMGLSVFLGSLAFRSLGGDLSASTMTEQLLPALVGPLAHQVANNFFVASLISQVRNTRFFRTWLSFIRELLWSNLLGIPTAILIAVLYVRVHHAFALMFLLSLPFQRWALRLFIEKRGTYARIIQHLVRAGELSLPGTKGHAQRVATISTMIGRQLGLTERDVEAIEYAALLHDIGMIGMDDLVNSPEAPQQLIDAHARLGAEIVSELGRPDITEMVRNHHTAFHSTAATGTQEVQVSLAARVIALAEEVDSLLHGLFPHPAGDSFESVLAWVDENRGRLFDPQVVDAFLTVIRENRLAISSPSTLSPSPLEG